MLKVHSVQSLGTKTSNDLTDGVILWKKAQIFKKGKNEIIEVPIVLGTKQVPFFDLDSNVVQPKDYKAIGDAAFDRLVIYKNTATNKIDKRVVTYIPDTKSLSLLNGDISDNWINKLNKKFSGYLEYRNFDGSIAFVVRVTNGRQVRRYRLTPAAPSDSVHRPQTVIQSVKSPNLKVSELQCWMDDIFQSTYSYWIDGEGVKHNRVEGETSSHYTALVCIDDGQDTTPQPGDGGGSGGDNGGDSGGSSGGGSDGQSGIVLAPVNNTEFTQDIKNVNLPDCFSNVLNDLDDLNNNCIGNVITSFSGNTPGYRWQVEDGGGNANFNGVTDIIYPNNVYTVRTTFYTDNFAYGSDIGIAKTIIHEGVHAYLRNYFHNDVVNASKTYPQMVEEWNATKHPDMNAIQHDQLVTDFIGEIATLLEAYGQSKGLNIDYQYYNDLAWGGLTDTHAFKALPQADQDRINDVILTEQKGEDHLENSVTKKGNPGGC